MKHSLSSALLILSFFAFTASSGVQPPSIKAGPGKDSSVVQIRFDYKQSALFQAYTKEVIDSVTNILLKDTAIRITIDGFAHEEEGSDTICYYLSLNRALFVRDYILGRGVDSNRITSTTGFGRTRPMYKGIDKEGKVVNCRAEITLRHPAPKVYYDDPDQDEDGIADNFDQCPQKFGLLDKNGCPDENAIIVPFGEMFTGLFSRSYEVMDSVVSLMKNNPAYTVSIAGHAYPSEGNERMGMRLAEQRAAIVNAYLLSRYIPASRIDTVMTVGNSRPINPGKNHLEIFMNCRAEILLNRHE